MSHDYHEGPADAVLYDGCAECDERARDPLMGLLNCDAHNFDRLRGRMSAVEYGGESYRTENEARLGHALHRIQTLLERHGSFLR